MELDYYHNLSEKEDFFKCKTINTLDEFDAFISESNNLSSNQNIIYRGVCAAKYKLYNSAQRYWITNDLEDFNGESYTYFIYNLIKNAEKYQGGLLETYFKAFGCTPNDFSILSFLQHYGAPTPLLDWTKSFDYGLFFAVDKLTDSACNEIDNYFSFYALDTTRLIERKRVLRDNVSELIPIYEYAFTITEPTPQKDRIIADFNHLEYTTYGEGVCYIDGYNTKDPAYRSEKLPNLNVLFYQPNLNVIAQNGCFIHFNYNDIPQKPLEAYFKETQDDESRELYSPKIICWNIHKHLREKVYKHLNEQKEPITRELLYPQEENIAKAALKEYLKNKPISYI